MSKEDLLKNYEDKILALKTQMEKIALVQKIIGGIEVLEKLKEELTTPTKEEKK